MEKVTITFADGTSLTAELNGNTYIVDEKPEFPKDLSVVKVNNGETVQELHYAEVIECASVDDRYWFGFVEVPESVRTERQVRADIDYIALMSDIEL